LTKAVGILTFHDGYNFGAILQAYALQKTIANFGYSCSVINYRRPGIYPLFVLPKNIQYFKEDILNIINIKSHLKLRRRYLDFQKNYICMTCRIYRSLSDFYCFKPEFDVYVVGSDQVWNPYFLDRKGNVGSIYYLEFVSSGRRVAYAPSFGVSEIPEVYKKRISNYITQFDYVSSREDTGCSNIKEMTGLSAEHVLDPTLLHESGEYDKITVEPTYKGPYILMYPMHASELLERLVLTVRKKMGLPIVALLPSHFNPRRFSFAEKVIFDAGPAEFLGWMKNASFICTNSYHGICFSIIYRKNFLVVNSTIGNTRIKSLLKIMDLTSRQITNLDKIEIIDELIKPLEYKIIEKRITDEKNKSLKYLNNSLV
jgi:hypothetical protein